MNGVFVEMNKKEKNLRLEKKTWKMINNLKFEIKPPKDFIKKDKIRRAYGRMAYYYKDKEKFENLSKNELFHLLETGRKNDNGKEIIVYYGSYQIPEHRLVYLIHYGEIKEGCHIHHIDGNKKNNDINNLVELSNAVHITLWENKKTKLANTKNKEEKYTPKCYGCNRKNIKYRHRNNIAYCSECEIVFNEHVKRIKCGEVELFDDDIDYVEESNTKEEANGYSFFEPYLKSYGNR